MTSIGSAFGHGPRRTTELIAAGFSISNPRARLVASPTRAMNEAFAIANTIWTLSASQVAEDIAIYNPRGRMFASGGVMEGAVGARIRSTPAGDQMSLVVDTLRRFPSSRRAVMQIFSPSDLAHPPRDTPCTLSLQYFLRGGRLEAVTMMRSQSAALLLPYDVYVFTMLQEVIASELEVQLGSYHHLCGSLHFYEDEEVLVDRLLDEPNLQDAAPMETMPPGALRTMNTVIAAERAVRSALMSDPNTQIDVRGLALSPYWSSLINVLIGFLRSDRGNIQ